MAQAGTKTTMKFNVDFRIICIGLLIVIAVMVWLWKPWAGSEGANARTIEVTGQASLTAKPDEFVFYPTYEVKNAEKQVALDQLTEKSKQLVTKLKELGIASSKIKTTTSGYDYPVYFDKESEPTYTLQLTVTVDNLGLAQRVQDYLVTTTPTGAVSPQASFSEQKRKTLEDQARTKATKDARPG